MSLSLLIFSTQRDHLFSVIMSQLSDIHSPLYERDPVVILTDTLSDLPSDDIQPFSTEASSSRQLLSSTPDSDFPRPLAVPSSLQLVGPGCRKGYFLYTDTNKDDFVHWWLRTAYGSTSEGKKFNWDRRGHLSDVWKHFDQIASSTDGLPKVMSHRCGKILDHTGHMKAGTNSMGRHWKGEKCRRAGNQAQQPKIRQLLQNEVSKALSIILNA